MSLGLAIFYRLCEAGNALAMLRDMSPPGSDQWLWHTEVLGMLDKAIDVLVLSQGLEGDDDAC